MSKHHLNYRDFMCYYNTGTAPVKLSPLRPCPPPPPPPPCCCPGPQGESAYEVAVRNGYIGTEEEWLASLKGDKGDAGPFLSGYYEILANAQTVAEGGNVVFDPGSEDSAGSVASLESDNMTVTINQTGLYSIEWNLNLAETSVIPAVAGITENGEPASGVTASNFGNVASGTLINVETVPFTVSLHNYVGELVITNLPGWLDSAGSLRIVRFADGAIE